MLQSPKYILALIKLNNYVAAAEWNKLHQVVNSWDTPTGVTQTVCLQIGFERNIYFVPITVFTQQPLKAVMELFSLMASSLAGDWTVGWVLGTILSGL